MGDRHTRAVGIFGDDGQVGLERGEADAASGDGRVERLAAQFGQREDALVVVEDGQTCAGDGGEIAACAANRVGGFQARFEQRVEQLRVVVVLDGPCRKSARAQGR